MKCHISENSKSDGMKDELALRIKPGDEQAFELILCKNYIQLSSQVNKLLKKTKETWEIVHFNFINI